MSEVRGEKGKEVPDEGVKEVRGEGRRKIMKKVMKERGGGER